MKYTPPASAVANAKKGLKLRKQYGRGGLSPAEAKSQGIDSGVTRARKIARSNFGRGRDWRGGRCRGR